MTTDFPPERLRWDSLTPSSTPPQPLDSLTLRQDLTQAAVLQDSLLVKVGIP